MIRSFSIRYDAINDATHLNPSRALARCRRFLLFEPFTLLFIEMLRMATVNRFILFIQFCFFFLTAKKSESAKCRVRMHCQRLNR